MGCGSSSEDVISNRENAPVDSGFAKGLKKYVKLEQKILQMEKDNPWEKIRMKSKEIEDLDAALEAKRTDLRVLEKKTGQNIPNIQALEKELKDAVQENAGEKAEALNKQIILTTDINNLTASREKIAQEIKSLEAEAERLQDLYSKQDAVLDGVFGGDYGSLKENELEQEWEIYEKRREKASEIRSRWSQARSKMAEAYVHLKSAAGITAGGSEDDGLTEDERTLQLRNSISTAASCFESSKRNLGKVHTSFCTEETVEALQNAAANVYKDGEPSTEPNNFYDEMLKNAASFVLWVEEVLKERIIPYEESQVTNAREKSQALRRERIRLLREKAQELGVDAKDTEVEPGVYEEYQGTQVANPEEEMIQVDRDELHQMRADQEREPLPTIELILGSTGPRRATKPAAASDVGGSVESGEDNRIISDSLREKLEARRLKRTRKRTKSTFQIQNLPQPETEGDIDE